MNKPARLTKGDRVAVFVPSSPIKDAYRQEGLAKIRELGFLPMEVDDIQAGDHYLAKRPADSFADIQALFLDRQIKALWAARGGYGANHLLPLLSNLDIPEPKIVIGSSDVSYLLWYLLDKKEMVVFYGPMAYSTLADDRANLENLIQVLSGEYSRLAIPGRVLKAGKASGLVTGGCLANLVSLVGSAFFPLLDERLLLLEDTGERPYRLDRMVWQLHQVGVFAKIKALLLGQFPDCFKNDQEKTHFLSRVQDYLNDRDIPILYDLPFGHGENIHTLPLGIAVEIDSAAFPGLIIEEKAVMSKF